MKQTESAVRMLISAYKAVLTNCYIKENLLGGGKRLVKGAALSSFLTAVLAGVSSPSFAAQSLDPITNDNCNKFNESSPAYEDDVNIVGQDDVENGSAIDITANDKKIVVATEGDNHSIELESDVYGIKLGNDKESTDNVSINLNAAGNNVIKVSENADSNVGDGINISKNVNNGSVTLTAVGNNEINATSKNGDAIYIDTGANAEVILKAGALNKIVAGNNGIDNNGSQSITLTTDGANIITGGVAREKTNDGNQGDGIRVQNSGSVAVNGSYNQISGFDEGLFIHASADAKEGIKVTANGTDGNGFGNIISGDDNGIESAGSAGINVSAEKGSNRIYGGNSAILNSGSGTIMITAGERPDESGISLLANQVGVDNLIGVKDGEYSINGIESDGTGLTDVYASHNNTIFGTENGILSTDSGTINVTSGNNNIIGQYEDEEEIVHTSKIGVNVKSGTVNLITGNENRVYATKNGIFVDNTSSLASLNAKFNIIDVVNTDNIMDGSSEIHAVGVKSLNGGTVSIGIKDYYSSNKTIISTSTTRGNSVAVWAENGNINFYGDSLNIKAENTDSEDGYAQTVGVMAGDIINNEGECSSNVSLNSNNNIDIYASTTATNVDTYGVKISQQSEVDLNSLSGGVSIRSEVNSSNTDQSELYGVAVYDSGKFKINRAESLIIKTGSDKLSNGLNAYGLLLVGNTKDDSESQAIADLSINGDIEINTYVKGGITDNAPNLSYGIESTGKAKVTLDSNNGSIYINTKGGFEKSYSAVFGLSADGQYSSIDLTAKENIGIESDGYQSFAVNLNNNSNISLNSDKDISVYAIAHNLSGGSDKSARSISNYGSTVKMEAETVNLIAENEGTSVGIYTRESRGSSKVTASSLNLISYSSGNNVVNSIAYGIYTYNNAMTQLSSSGDILISANRHVYDKDKGIYVYNDNNTNAGTGIYSIYSGTTSLSANSIYVYSSMDGVNAGYYNPISTLERSTNGNVTLTSNVNNIIEASRYGVVSAGAEASVLMKANNNIITSNSKNGDHKPDNYGNSYAVYSLDGSTVTMEAGNSNQLQGAVYANGNGTNVFIGNIDESSSNLNVVQSYAYIKEAGDLDKDTTEGEASFKDKTVISALYAEEGANISLTGASNYLRTYADSAEYENTLERVVWAYNGKEGKGTSINIDGYTQISTDSYTESRNSADIALAAGTAVNLDEQDVSDSKDMAVEDRAKVIVDYADLVDENGNTIASSSITGDILAAYQGYVDIKPKESSDAGIDITGNILAGNNGIVNINLGKEGSLTGRADDYGDAGVIENSEHTKFFNPAFSSAIHEGGAVNLTMGEGSRWDVTGQSWVTSVNTGIFDSTADDVSYLPMIDLTHANNDINQKAAGLTVYSFSGDSKFRMNLDGNELNKSNMLYMKNANGTYYIELEDTVSRDEINTTLHDGLRFATVGKDSNVEFHVGSIDNGVFNIEYEIGQDNYDETVAENERYNGSQLDEQKPGDSTVKEFFGNDGTPVEEVSGESEIATANAVMALAETSDEAVDTAQQDNLTGAVNHKIIDIKSATTSDIGKTVIDMSRANYANAVYMDTLNKRQGEARFVGDTDHGVWVRLRHDNIGKEDSFRSHNTMVEVGIDQRDVHDYGEFHTGVALDYMNGSLDYHTVDGDGDIERYGVWFYTTFLGNDGQYADLILKYGHLKNDFGFNTRNQGEHVTGAYTNETASLSAEYGWKFSNSHNYYIEPQAQLQYTYVTGADYTTSQGTKVDLDSIHSLIGRIGFRAGKDFNTETPITAYIRGDVLHEFLGDQDIYAYDSTGVMDVTYKNDDTWYSAGVGLSVQSSENTYFFIEGEQVFGADNDSTYTVSGGFKHSF